MARIRLRDLGVTIGEMPTGSFSAITDVAGVRVGHTTLVYDHPRIARTGVTVIVPPGADDGLTCCAGYHRLNGNGEMTGLLWVEEAGALDMPLAITNTHQVGLVRDALIEYVVTRQQAESWMLPIVAETYDGTLNDISGFHVTKEHVFAALDAAVSGPVAEGNVGSGTGMICHEFKGGIGTSSRRVQTQVGEFIVGVLVQANYGRREDLRLNGVSIGEAIGVERFPSPWRPAASAGSIIIIVATDAPLLPDQCRRLAQRAGLGLARVGGFGHNGSGDIFLAFASGNLLPKRPNTLVEMRMVPHHAMDPLFRATVESTEEAIWNALLAAETMTGFLGRTAYAVPVDEVARLVGKSSSIISSHES